MTLWGERPDKTLQQAIDNCQTAEKIISVMQDISGEAMSMNKMDKLSWCNHYIDELRKIELRKYDEITSHIFEYMEQHCKRSAEEIAQIKQDQRGRTGKGDLTLKEYVQLTEKRKDLLFGIWANVQSKNMMHEGVSFLAPSGKVIFKSWLPQKQATQQIVLRCLWTSYDYLTSNKEQDDIVIGGITDFRMFTYPETAKT